MAKKPNAKVKSLPTVATGALVRFKEFFFDPEDETGQTVIIDCLVRFNSEVAPGADSLPVSVPLTAPEQTILQAIRQAVKGLVLEQQTQPLTNAQIFVDAIPK